MPLLVFVVLAFANLAPSAHADTLQGTFVSGVQLDGTVDFGYVVGDPTSYQIYAADLTATFPYHGQQTFRVGPYSQNIVYTAPGSPESFVAISTFADDHDPSYGEMDLIFPVSSFLSGSGPVCSLTDPCFFSGQELLSEYIPEYLGQYGNLGGDLQIGSVCASDPCAATVTPEPAPLLLLGTGLLGLSGVAVARRLTQRATPPVS